MEDKTATIEHGAILKAFQEKDKNRDGFLSREEIVQSFLQATNGKVKDKVIAEEHVDKFMEQYDVNKDGRINYVEFLQGTLKYNNANVVPSKGD